MSFGPATSTTIQHKITKTSPRRWFFLATQEISMVLGNKTILNSAPPVRSLPKASLPWVLGPAEAALPRVPGHRWHQILYVLLSKIMHGGLSENLISFFEVIHGGWPKHVQKHDDIPSTSIKWCFAWWLWHCKSSKTFEQKQQSKQALVIVEVSISIYSNYINLKTNLGFRISQVLKQVISTTSPNQGIPGKSAFVCDQASSRALATGCQKHPDKCQDAPGPLRCATLEQSTTFEEEIIESHGSGAPRNESKFFRIFASYTDPLWQSPYRFFVTTGWFWDLWREPPEVLIHYPNGGSLQKMCHNSGQQHGLWW